MRHIQTPTDHVFATHLYEFFNLKKVHQGKNELCCGSSQLNIGHENDAWKSCWLSPFPNVLESNEPFRYSARLFKCFVHCSCSTPPPRVGGGVEQKVKNSQLEVEPATHFYQCASFPSYLKTEMISVVCINIKRRNRCLASIGINTYTEGCP